MRMLRFLLAALLLTPYLAFAAAAVESSTRTHGNTDALVVALGGPSEGEGIQITVIATNGGTARTMSMPGGWTEHEEGNNGDFASSYALYTKVAVASESNPTITLSSSDGVVAIATVISGVSSVRVADLSAGNSNGTTIVSPSVAATSGDFVVEQAAAAGFDGGGMDYTIPTNNSEAQGTQSGDADASTGNAEDAYFTASGTTSAATWTNAASDNHKVASTVAWVPSGGGGATIPIFQHHQLQRMQ